MTPLRRWITRLSEWRRSRAVERDLAEELESHLAHLIDDHIRRGLSPADARRAAQLELGGLDQAKALARDARGFRVMDAVVTDTVLAFRQLRKTPAFTSAAVMTLALGVGANTAIFSLVDAVMLRPLPYTDPQRVVSVWEEVEARRIAVAPANFVDYQARVRAFDSLAAVASLGKNLTGDGPPERVISEEVTASYFRVVGITPAIGRPLRDEENTAGHERVVVISHGLWQRRYGGDRSIVGRVIRLNNQPFEVVGVMPPGFVAPSAVGQVEPVSVWLPIVFEPEVLTNRQEHIVSVIGRLAAGATVESARAELSAVSAALGREFPETASTTASLDLLRRDQVTTVRTMLVVLLVAVGLVLLLACINVAGLLIVRAMGRRREIAIRYALGASRSRVLLEQVVQSVVLAGLGGAAGLALGGWTTRLLVSVAPSSIPHIATATLDLRVVAFTAIIVMVTALAFGLWPAWQAAGTDPIDTLKAHERPTGGAWVLNRRGVLLIAEVAVSTMVLVGAGLMIRSLVTLNRVDLGFDPSHVLAASVTLPQTKYPTPESRLAFFEQLAARVRELPGVRQVAFGNRLPLRGDWISGMFIDPAGTATTATPEMREAGFQAVSAAYFTTVGIPLRQGRLLTSSDTAGADPVAIVNETFSRRLLGGGDPIGRRIRRGPTMPANTIVGVVGDIRRTGRAADDGRHSAEVIPQVYLSAAQTGLYPLPLRDIAVKVDSEGTAAIASEVQRLVYAMDPDQPVTSVRTLEETLALGAAQKRFQTGLFIVFAAVAFGLALVGIYGVVAYAVSQRTPEIALRMALGATRGRVLRAVVGRSTQWLTVGVVIGLAGAWVASDVISDLLFEVDATEPLTYVLVGLILTGSGAVAAAAAAKRATRIDPMLALK